MELHQLQQSDVYARVKHYIKLDSNASLIAGGIAGAVSRTIVSPFERAKILLQLQGAEAQKAYRGMFPTIWRMYKDEGWRGWFRGNTLNCVRIVPYSAVQFAVFEKCKQVLLLRKPENGKLTEADRLLAGSIGGISSVAATYPLDLVRARITVQTASLAKLNKAKLVKAPGVWETLSDVYKNEGGIRALYRGIVPTTMGVAPYVAINFAMYEYLRDRMDALTVYDFSNPLWKLSAGAFSSFVGGVLIYPLDLLRKRYQVANMAGGELGFQYRSVGHALVTIFKREGYFGAYKGLTANLYKIVPSMAVSWLCYDSLKAAIAEW